jgi:hypothetical protein
MKDIKWHDGKNANGKYVLEIIFNNGSTGYLKNENYEKISEQYSVLFDCPTVAGMTLYNSDGKAIATKNKTATAA